MGISEAERGGPRNLRIPLLVAGAGREGNGTGEGNSQKFLGADAAASSAGQIVHAPPERDEIDWGLPE